MLLLQDTHRTLMPAKQSATNGHVTLLKQKMLTAILRRVDSVLFEKLTAGLPAVLLYVVKSQMRSNHIKSQMRLNHIKSQMLLNHIKSQMRLNGGLSMQITSLHCNSLDIVTPVLLEELMVSCKYGLDVQHNAAELCRSVKSFRLPPLEAPVMIAEKRKFSFSFFSRSVKLSQIWARMLPAEPKPTRKHVSSPRLLANLVLGVCCFPSYCLLTPLMSPKDKKCKLIN